MEYPNQKTRRDFVKTSAFSVAAITVLAAGHSLADAPSATATATGMASGTSTTSTGKVRGTPAGSYSVASGDPSVTSATSYGANATAQKCAKMVVASTPTSGTDNGQVSLSLTLTSWTNGSSTVDNNSDAAVLQGNLTNAGDPNGVFTYSINKTKITKNLYSGVYNGGDILVWAEVNLVKKDGTGSDKATYTATLTIKKAVITLLLPGTTAPPGSTLYLTGSATYYYTSSSDDTSGSSETMDITVEKITT